MTSCFRVYPYGPSNTATSLVEGLDGLLIKRERSRYIPNRNHVVINWGSGTRPAILPPNWPVINRNKTSGMISTKLVNQVQSTQLINLLTIKSIDLIC